MAQDQKSKAQRQKSSDENKTSKAPEQTAINPLLLNPEIQQWIRQTTATLEEIAFAPLPFAGVLRQELLQQVEGYRKTCEKLPRWSEISGLLFPAKISLEQCSSETTAHYKAAIVARHFGGDLQSKESRQVHGKLIADITGGFGVDAYYLAQSGARVHHFELDELLSDVVRHNMAQLKANVICHHGDGLKGLQELKQGAQLDDLKQPLDLIYLDPARRDTKKNKVFRLEDCTPDILTHLDYLLEYSPNILLKTSPMLDLQLGLRQLKKVTEIHVVAVNNEVKEILWFISRSAGQMGKNQDAQDDKSRGTQEVTDHKNPKVYAVNLSPKSSALDSNSAQNNDIFEFIWNQRESTKYSAPLAYIYEPNGPLRKIGQYAALTQRLPVVRIGPNAHLFTAEQSMDFPGRIFEVLDKWPFTKPQMKHFKGQKYNITTRDFPLTVAKIRATWQIKDGGDEYLFFTTDSDGQKWIILCRKPQ